MKHLLRKCLENIGQSNSSDSSSSDDSGVNDCNW
jgi:hypothetical protein